MKRPKLQRNSRRKDQAKPRSAKRETEPAPSSTVPPNRSRFIFNRIEIAELMGVHPDTITDNTRLGMPVVTVGGHGKESEYDAVACLSWWRERQGKNALQNAQTKLFQANAEKAETSLAQTRGQLVLRQEVIFAGQAFVKAWSAKLLSLATRLRHLGLITREQEAGVAAVVKEILTEIASWKTVGDALDAAKDSAA